ncbi:MAG: conjugal transfer protein TraH [Ahniella sp.]|nr:conjugal transfer protein TraH [Ahniella sp.]
MGQGIQRGRARAERPDEFARIEPGNIVWRLLKERGVGQWFDDSDEALLIDIQSFLGTVIVCAPNDASACADGATEPEDRPGETRVRQVPAVLGLDDLVHGDGDGTRTVSIIQCDDRDTCLRARIAESQSERVGLRRSILDTLIGNPQRGVVGYVQRARLAQAEGTPSELALRSNAPSQFGVLDQAIDINEHTAITVAEVLAESMAVEMVEAVLATVLDAIRQGASQLGAAESAQLLRLAEEATLRLQQQRSGIDARFASRARTLDGLGLTIRLAPTPDLRAGPIAAPGR